MMPDNPREVLPSDRQTLPSSKAPKAPKAPAKDMSNLPQKPITLKPDVSLPPALKKVAVNSISEKKNNASPVKKSRRRSSSKTTITTGWLSPEIEKIATDAAAREGVTLHNWVEELIRSQSQARLNSETQSFTEIADTLHQIDKRLSQLEKKNKGFWSLFWEQFIEPYRQKS